MKKFLGAVMLLVLCTAFGVRAADVAKPDDDKKYVLAGGFQQGTFVYSLVYNFVSNGEITSTLKLTNGAYGSVVTHVPTVTFDKDTEGHTLVNAKFSAFLNKTESLPPSQQLPCEVDTTVKVLDDVKGVGTIKWSVKEIKSGKTNSSTNIRGSKDGYLPGLWLAKVRSN